MAGIDSFTAELNRRDKSNRNVSVRFGTVTAVSGVTVTVTLGGADIPNVNRLESYTPTVGDSVIVLRAGSTMVVLGSIA